MDFEVAKIGERGQLVIPQSFREEMSIHKGDKFMVLQEGEMILLKKLIAPSKSDFEMMLKRSHAHAKKHGLVKRDMDVAIKKARRK